MRPLLAVYNICGISGRENAGYYISAINSVLNQPMFNTEAGCQSKLVISGCHSSPAARELLMRTFGGRVSYNWIPDQYPLSVTFNHSVDKMIEHFGKFFGYLYIDSGIRFPNSTGIGTLFLKHTSNQNAITAALPSNDHGFEWWHIPYPTTDYFFPPGKTTNMHCQIFDEDWRSTYGRILPDIFASDTSESVFYFLAAALQKRFMITPEVFVEHQHAMDGPSSGFRGKILYPGLPGQKTMDQIYREGVSLGFGYEECDPQKRWMHDPSKYNSDGFPIEPLPLLAFMKENLFLPDSLFDYKKITHTFHAGDL